MGPESEHLTDCEFLENVSPHLDGHSDYAAYRDDISFWTKLTSLPSKKHGHAIISRLKSETKTDVETIPTQDACCERVVELVVEKLEKAYAVDETNNRNTDLK